MSERFTPFFSSSYSTSTDACTTLGRFLPNLRFFAGMVKIVLRSGIAAKQGRYDSAAWAESSLDTLQNLEKSGVRVLAEGMDNINAVQGPCVFIGNHMSTLETLVLPIFIQPKKEVTFITKESLLRYPFFGPVLQSRDPITVGRANPRKDLTAVLEGGISRLQAGRSIIVFPQSTRSRTFDPAGFNTIGVKLAKRAGVPIVPIALQTSAWGIGKLVKELGPLDKSIPVRFAFGEPFSVTGPDKEAHAKVCAFIQDHLTQWTRQLASTSGAALPQ